VILKFSEQQCSFESPLVAAVALKGGIKHSGHFEVNEDGRTILTLPEKTMHFDSAAAAIEHLESIIETPPPLTPPSPRLVVEHTNAKFKGTPPDVLAFKGGGTKGVAYVGALERLHDEDLYEQVTKFAGTSAGAQQAAFCAFGFQPCEMRKLLHEAPWKDLLDRTPWYAGGSFSNIHRLLKQYGYCKGDALEGYLEQVFEKQTGIKYCTFQQLYDWRMQTFDNKDIKLRLGVINMTTQKFEYLDRHTHPNMPVSKACRASSSIPVVFTPVYEGDAVYIDGGLEGNLPVRAFEDDPGQTLAFNLVSKDKKTTGGQFNKFIHFATTIVNMVFDAAQGYHGVDPHQELSWDLENTGVDVVNINCGDHGALETNLDEVRFKDLADRGREAVDRYLSQHPGCCQRPPTESPMEPGEQSFNE